MNKILIITLLFFIPINLLAQDIKISDLDGEWLFIEMQDEKGNNVTELPMPQLEKITGEKAIEKINRPNIILKEDGGYEKRFTDEKADTGFWEFDKESNELSFTLRISPDSPYLKYLKNIITKRSDGFYYQKPIFEKIVKFEKNIMFIADYVGYYSIYKRK